VRAIWTAPTRKIGVMTFVVNLNAFGNGAFPAGICPTMGQPKLLTEHSELAVSGRRSKGGPFPASIFKFFDLRKKASFVVKTKRAFGYMRVLMSSPPRVVHVAHSFASGFPFAFFNSTKSDHSMSVTEEYIK